MVGWGWWGGGGGGATDLSARFAPVCWLVEVTECSRSLHKFPFIKSPSCGKHMTRSHTGSVGGVNCNLSVLNKTKKKNPLVHLYFHPRKKKKKKTSNGGKKASRFGKGV